MREPTQTLAEDGELALRRRRAGDGSAILILAPVREQPAPAILARLEHEYALRAELDPAWAVRPRALVHEAGKTSLILDDPGGDLLEHRLGEPPGSGPLPPAQALPLAVALTQALGQVHARGLIHKDLTPAHVLVDGPPHAPRVRLLGFGLASRLPSERQAPEPPEVVAGTLPYLAPEQTGRMNRSVDARSDLYALGVILYRMFTGDLPFSAADPLEWIHCHIARQPVPPAERVSGLPAALSDVVMKLLAKTAEERYQTAAGAAADLARCLVQWTAAGRIEPFALGRGDASDQLRIPEKLYGREAQAQALFDAFDRVAATGAAELVLVSGYSGIGKSSVVNELQRGAVSRRGLFASGKFEQYRQGTPYGPLAQALRTLVRHLLCKGEDELAAWRQALDAALGANGRLVADLVPDLERVIGPQPPVPQAPPVGAENRFHRVLGRFLGVFARREHPLILFLDDLQWLDPATLRFLEYLVTHPDTRHLLAVGAYRDNEVGPAHPLGLTLDAIRKAGTAVGEIVLAPLALDHVGRLLADSLHCSLERALPLARLVLDKTAGNPFFAIQFVTNLREEGLLVFDRQASCWTWDLERIRAQAYTDNVIDLMLAKLKRLAPGTQTMLGWLACLGKSAEAELLALAQGRSVAQTETDLWPALRAGFVFALGGGYRFSHDRVQEAAYALIPPARRAARHLAIGRHLLARLPPQALAARLFDVVDQLNRGEQLITAAAERHRLGRLNAQAGRRAKAAIAYAAACGYLARATALLPANAWRDDYEETFALHLDLAQCEYLAGRLDAANQVFEAMRRQARSPLDKARIGRLRCQLHQLEGHFDLALAVILAALEGLGIRLPEGDAALLAYASEAIDKLRAGFGEKRAIARLADLPKATDATAKMIAGLAVEGLLAAYATRPACFPFLAALAVNHSLRHGNCEDSAFAYYAFGIVLIAFRWDLQAGFEFSEAALKLVDRFDNPRPRGALQAGHGGLVVPWRRHLAESLPFLERGLAMLLDAGDFFSAGAMGLLPVWAVLELGQSLDRLTETAEKYAALARQVHNPLVEQTVLISRRLVASLQGRTSPPHGFDGEGFSEAECAERFRQGGWHTGVAYFSVMKLLAACFYGRYREALAAAAEAEPVLSQMGAMQVAASLHFYRLLALAGLYPQATAEEQQDYARRLAEGLARLRFWAENCPANYAHRHALVAAEIARIEGRELDAERLFEQAIDAARDNGFSHHEALACERAASFFLARGLRRIALAYLRDARYAYLRWGAQGKVRQLEAAWPQLAEPAGTAAAIGAPLEQLDVATVFKASQAVSSDILLDRLTQTLMRIALEHAGADRGLLLLPEAAGYRIAARATIDQKHQKQLRVDLGSGPPSGADLPESLLHYVARSRETVLLDDVAAPHLFSADPYLASKGKRTPKAILALPLVKQAKLVGILYLENHLAPRAFTRKQIAVLELIASQAAISLENARLYANLEEREARIRRLVDANIIGIFFGNLRGDCLAANDALLEMVGYSRREFDAGKIRWADMTPPEYRALDEQAIAELKASGRCHPYEKEFVRKDGSRVPVLIGATLFEGSMDEGVSFVLDLSERKRAEAAQQARQAAELASRTKSAFLASMSHELRTPLNAILGYAQLLGRDSRLDARQRFGIATIRHSGEYLLSLIDDILDLSKIEAGKLELHAEATDLPALLRSVADIVQPRVAQKDLAFTLALPPNLPRTVSVDEKRLCQVLLNLLSNALKFTDRGEVRLEVQRLPGPEQEARLSFAVHDSGVGIAAEQLERIFQPFEQVGEFQRRSGGTGLGLTISRQLVRLMGGDIHVESRPDRGSRFWFDLSLPITQTALAAAPEQRAVVGYRGPPRHVLVVEDVEASRLMLTEFLSSLGFIVDAAADGQQAIERALASRPDLIVLDTMLPVLDGLAVTRKLRQMPDFSRTTIIMVSASVAEDRVMRCLAAGADCFVAKPIEFDRLLEQIGLRLGLTWIHQGLPEPAPLPEGPLVAPPQEEMEILHRLALMGSMREIKRQAEHVASLDPRYRPFAHRLIELADAFQSKAILQLVEKHLEKDDHGQRA